MTKTNPMTALKKVQNLVWAMVKPSQRDEIRDTSGYIAYIDESHIMMVELFDDGTPAGAKPDKMYSGRYDDANINIPAIAKYDADNMVCVDRSYLMTVLNNLDGDDIRFYMDDNTALKIGGSIGDKHVIARIAPRILDNERDIRQGDISPAIRPVENTPDIVTGPTDASVKGVC